MASRGGWLNLPDGEITAIEDSARQASRAVRHLRLVPNLDKQPCGHLATTACTQERCSVFEPFKAL